MYCTVLNNKACLTVYAIRSWIHYVSVRGNDYVKAELMHAIPRIGIVVKHNVRLPYFLIASAKCFLHTRETASVRLMLSQTRA